MVSLLLKQRAALVYSGNNFVCHHNEDEAHHRLDEAGRRGHADVIELQQSTIPVSYTHLDVYKRQPVNLTNHSYFNLNGGGSVLEHRLYVNAERFCENDAGCLPTGQLLWVEGTPFDFRTPKAIGADIGADCEQLRRGGGYDHNFVLSGKHAATLYSPDSRIELVVEMCIRDSLQGAPADVGLAAGGL